jgi:hypothetical protein
MVIASIGFKRWQEATLAAHKAGVPMILGTDCGANNTPFDYSQGNPLAGSRSTRRRQYARVDS